MNPADLSGTRVEHGATVTCKPMRIIIQLSPASLDVLALDPNAAIVIPLNIQMLQDLMGDAQGN